MSYELKVEELSKLHLTTRIAASSLKWSPQKISCRVVDADHEIFSGQRRTVAHRREEALKAEFFTKQVLCPGDAIGIKNQPITRSKIG